MSQEDKLLAAFKRRSMTTLAAMQIGILSFHKIMSNLKNLGHRFEAEYEGRTGAKYLRYKLVQP